MTSPECESPRGFLHWGAEMHIESADAGPCELWVAWDEDRSCGGVTVCCLQLDDAIDRVMWARDRAHEGGVAEVAAFG
ncbi:Uncharacterised protein [Burkholderia pseudomallei]|nr:Uncharacterised protein [Burkholderia pseudomallei]